MGAAPSHPLVYAAHPLTCYSSAHERACLAAIAAALPEAEVVDPAECFADDADWLARWPALVAVLSAVVLFADEEGCVGAGCLREVADAIAAGLPVLVLDDRQHLCELEALRLLPASLRTAARVGVVEAGEVVTAALAHPTRHPTRGSHHAHL